MSIHPLDLIRIYIGRGHLHRGRQIDDDLLILRGTPGLLYCRADLQSVVQLGAGKALRRILQQDLPVKVRRILLHQLGADHGNLLDLFLILMEYYVPLKGGRGIINMYNSLLNAL